MKTLEAIWEGVKTTTVGILCAPFFALYALAYAALFVIMWGAAIYVAGWMVVVTIQMARIIW